MPLYGWAGPGEMVELERHSTVTPEITAPTAPLRETQKFFYCRVDGCDRKFKKAMIVARHFNTAHSDLREDSDSWRQYVEEIQE